MGRWVRWFGSGEEASGTRVVTPPFRAKAAGQGAVAPAGGVRDVGGLAKAAIAPAPTGQISVETLPAEMLTAVLVEEGAFSREDENTCLQEHRATGRPVEDIICESELVAESELMAILSRRCKVPHLSLESYQIKPRVLESVPPEFARANRIMPLERLGKVLNVATSNPLDFMTFKRLEEETGLKVKPVLATPRELTACIDKHFPASEVREEQESTKESFRIKMRDALKDSLLGSMEEAEEPEPAAATADESEALADSREPETVSEDSTPVPLSEDEAGAFAKTSSGELTEAWLAAAGLAPSGGSDDTAGDRLAALAVSDAEFRLLAANEPGLPSRATVVSSSDGPTATSKKSGSSVTGWWRAFRKPPERAAKPKKTTDSAKNSKPRAAKKKKKSRKKAKKKKRS